MQTKANQKEIIEKLTNIGLEVEGTKENSSEIGKFKIAKILKAEKHPNADKLKVCDVNVGGNKILKVVCGAPNAKDGLITVYAPPGTIIPKTKLELLKYCFNGFSPYVVSRDWTYYTLNAILHLIINFKKGS